MKNTNEHKTNNHQKKSNQSQFLYSFSKYSFSIFNHRIIKPNQIQNEFKKRNRDYIEDKNPQFILQFHPSSVVYIS